MSDSNYYNDSRVRGSMRDRSFKFDICDDDGNWHEAEVPTKYAVCPVCLGKGTHVNPSIDCNGLSSEDFNDDPDFREDYFSGRYDQQCDTCNGDRVVLEADRDKMGKELLRLWDAELDERSMAEQERIYELRYGY